MIRRCTKKAAFKSASVKNSEYFTRQAYVQLIFYLLFRVSPENMVFLEKREQKVPRYKHIFTRLQISRLLTRKCPALIPVVFFIKCVNMLRPTKALSTLRRRNLKNASSLWKLIQCFPSTLRREIWKCNNQRSFWICVWGKLGRGNHVIIVTSSFSKSSVFKMFSVHTKTQSWRFDAF